MAKKWIWIMIVMGLLAPFYIGSIVLLLVTAYFLWKERHDFRNVVESIGWIWGLLVMSSLTSTWHRNWVGLGVTIVMTLMVLFASCYSKAVTSRSYQLILRSLNVGTLVVSLGAMLQYGLFMKAHNVPWTYILTESAPKFRAESTLFNANYLGLYCVLAVLVGIYSLLSEQQKKYRLLALGSIAFSLVAIVLTASRMVYPALFAGIAVLVFLLVPSRWKWGLLVVSSTLCALLMFNTHLIPRFASLDYGIQDRYGIWKAGWQIFLREPLIGSGPMSYAKYYYLFEGKTVPHAHQLLIDSLANYGLIGILLISASSVTYIRRLWEHWQVPSLRREVSMKIACLVAVLVHGLMDVSVFWLQTGGVFLIIMLGSSSLGGEE